MPNEMLLFAAGAVALAAIATLLATFFTVEQRTDAIVQRLGKFLRDAGPGLHVDEAFGVGVRAQGINSAATTAGV